MAEKKYETEFTWGKGLQPDLQDDKLSVKHKASLERRRGMAEGRGDGKVAGES